MRDKKVEVAVGVFIIIGLIALLVLAFKVSGLMSWTQGGRTIYYANFSELGGLKKNAPVVIDGVTVGEVTGIELIPGSVNTGRTTYQAKVSLAVDSQYAIPENSSADIFTSGLLGAKYISLHMGDAPAGLNLKPGGSFESVKNGFILEQFIDELKTSIGASRLGLGSK